MGGGAAKLKKNDPVGSSGSPTGRLLVTRKIDEEPLQRVKEIDVMPSLIRHTSSDL
jgi:hypothetical protein